MQRTLNARLLAAASRPTARQTCLPARRFYANKAASTEPAPTSSPSDHPSGHGDQTLKGMRVRDEGPGIPRTPDYNVATDYRTSTFSPIPKRVVDGSEPGDVLPAAVLSGAPIDLQARTVRIYRPAKSAMQSGDWHAHHWLMDWDPLPKGHRWENPLMGWQSSADFMQGERIQFKSKEDAIAFAEKHGYEYFVQEPNERRFVPKAYANNFVHSPKKLKIVRTK
ncbi:ETC complex I subunit conserved region-domain-containing protein [Phyllosticta citriasiana]|uniref:NADH dehydrogenase [ubiquinone] iron-sulfur protein 4, mitochondrial n=1 Tax=Phyllosticta citriasiana TaxID=595635 RepID=A0ABR1KA20_9PEZI